MANETKITDIVGKQAYEQLLKLDVEINKVLESYAYAAKEMAKGLSVNPTSISELVKKNKDYEESLRRIQSATESYNQLNKTKVKVLDEATAAMRAQIQAEKEAASIAASRSKLDADLAKAALNSASAKKNLAKATEEESRAELSSSRAKTNLAKASDIAARAEEQYGGIAKMTAVDVEKLISTLDIANLSYKEQATLLSQLKAFSKVQTGGVQVVSPNTLDTIQKLDASLKEQDAKLGIYGRNVGNYKSHWDGLGNSVAQLTREMPAFAVSVNTGFLALSNNIPILADEIKRIRLENQALKSEGLSTVPVWKQIAKSFLSWNTVLSVGITLITVYGKDIVDWGRKLFSVADASKEAAKAQKDLNSSTGNFAKEFQKSSSTYGENLVSIRKLQEEWTSLGDSLNEKKQFIIDNSTEFKKLDVSINNVSDAENFLVNNTDSFIKSLDARAKAAAAQVLAQEEYAKGLQKEVEAENRRKNPTFWDKIDFKTMTINLETEGKAYAIAAKRVQENANEAADGIQKEGKAAYTAGSTFFDAMIKFRKEEEAILSEGGMNKESNEEKLKREQDRLAREAKQREKLEMEAERNLQDSKMKLMEEGYEKEKASREASYQKRIDDVKTKGVRVNEQIVAIEAEREKDLSEFTKEYQANMLMENAKNRLESVKKGGLQELDAKLDILSLQKDKELKEAEKTGADKLAIDDKYNKLIENTYLDFGKNQLKRQQDQNEIELSEREIALNEELAILDKNYAKGLIKKRDYEKQKSDIVFKFATESLNNEINLLEQSIDLFSGDERLEMEKKIASLRVKLSKETTDKIISDGEREKKSKEDIEDAKKKLIQEAAKAIEDIGNSLFERRIQDVEKEIDENQKEYDEKIASIDALAEKDIITKEEAEARKRAAEAQTAAKNKELEKEKAALQTKQAKFQKTIDIANVIAATAVGVTKSLPNYILAALVAATGAIQLATIIAQPIPKYAKGTDNHPGGLAVVGDGGKHEAILSNGRVYITPNVPTLLDIPRSAQVLPDIQSRDFYDRWMDNSYYLTHNNSGDPVTINNNFDANGIIRVNERVEKAIHGLAKTISRNQRSSEFAAYKNMKMR